LTFHEGVWASCDRGNGRSRGDLVQGKRWAGVCPLTPVGVRAGVLQRWPVPFSVLVTKPDLVDLAHDAIELDSDFDLSLRRCSHCLVQERYALVQ
jgi:hypothetical protein